jgi:hypothetical protein
MYMRMSPATLRAGMGDAWRRMVDGYVPVLQQMPGIANRVMEAGDGWEALRQGRPGNSQVSAPYPNWPGW